MRAIDGDDLLRRTNFLLATIYTPDFVEILKALKEYLEKAPTLTLDDLRPKGRWERKEDGKVYCSVCQKKALEVKKGVWHIPNFCNHCGADMRGGGEDA